MLMILKHALKISVMMCVVHVNNIKACTVSIPTLNCCRIKTSCYSIPTLEDCQGRIWKGSDGIGSYRSPRPKQFCSDRVCRIAPPPKQRSYRYLQCLRCQVFVYWSLKWSFTSENPGNRDNRLLLSNLYAFCPYILPLLSESYKFQVGDIL